MSEKQSDARSVEEYLSTTAYLECRADGHAWKRQHSGWFVEGGGRSVIYSKRLACMRCAMQRTDRRNHGFERLSPVYTYPEAYLVKGLGIVKDDVVRFEIEQAVAAAEEAAAPAAPARRRRRR